MTPKQKLEVRASEIKVELAQLGAKETLDDGDAEKIGELRTEYVSVETRLQALTVAGDEPEKTVSRTDPDPEARERNRLRELVSVGTYLRAGILGRRVTGAEEEFRQAVSAEERTIPVEAFECEADRPPVETRAVTGAPATVGVNMTSLVPSVFARSAAEFLGIAMPRAPSGQYSIPRITTDLTAGTRAKGAAIEATAAAFTVISSKPKRLSAALSLTAEDLAEAGVPAFEASLRDNMRMVLGDALDVQLLRGDGSAPNITGLAKQLSGDTAQADANTYENATTDLLGYLDGRFAHMVSDLKAIHNVAVYQFLAGLRPTNDDSQTWLDWCSRMGVVNRGNANMAPLATKVGDSIVVRQGAARGHAGANAVCPRWGDIGITDPYTEADKATHSVYLHVMIGDVLLRYPGAYAQWKVKTA